MFKKIREYFKSGKEYKEAKKALALLIMNQYSDLLETETAAKDAELKAYESMSIFGETFNPEDLQNMISSVNKIAADPELQTDYYKKVHDDAQKEKNQKVMK